MQWSVQFEIWTRSLDDLHDSIPRRLIASVGPMIFTDFQIPGHAKYSQYIASLSQLSSNAQKVANPLLQSDTRRKRATPRTLDDATKVNRSLSMSHISRSPSAYSPSPIKSSRFVYCNSVFASHHGFSHRNSTASSPMSPLTLSSSRSLVTRRYRSRLSLQSELGIPLEMSDVSMRDELSQSMHELSFDELSVNLSESALLNITEPEMPSLGSPLRELRRARQSLSSTQPLPMTLAPRQPSLMTKSLPITITTTAVESSNCDDGSIEALAAQFDVSLDHRMQRKSSNSVLLRTIR